MLKPYTFTCKFKVFKYTSSQQGMSYSDSSVKSDGDEIYLEKLGIDDLRQNDATSCGIYAGFVYPLLLGRFGKHVTIIGQKTRKSNGSNNFIYQAAFAIAHLVYVQGFHKILDEGKIKFGIENNRDEEGKEIRIELEMLHEDVDNVHTNSLLIDVTPDSLVLMKPRFTSHPHFKYNDYRKSLWNEDQLPEPVQRIGKKLFHSIQNQCLSNFFVKDMASIFAPVLEFDDGTYYTYKNKNISFLADHIEQSAGGIQQSTRLEVLKKVALAQYFQTTLNINGKDSNSFVFFIHYMPMHYGLNVITLKSLKPQLYEGQYLYAKLPTFKDLECKIYDSSNGTRKSQSDYGATITRLASLHLLHDAKILSSVESPNTIKVFLKSLNFTRGIVEKKRKKALDFLIEQCCSFMQLDKQKEVQFVVYALNILREKIRSGWAEFPRASNDRPNNFEAFKRNIKKAVKEYILEIMPTLLEENIITVGNVITVDEIHRNINVLIKFEEDPWMLLAGWDQNWNFSPERKIVQNVRYSLFDTTRSGDNRITEPTLQGRSYAVDDENTRKYKAITMRKGIRLGGVDFIINSCEGVRGGSAYENQDCQNFEKSIMTPNAEENAYGEDFACYHNYIALVAIQNAVKGETLKITLQNPPATVIEQSASSQNAGQSRQNLPNKQVLSMSNLSQRQPITRILFDNNGKGQKKIFDKTSQDPLYLIEDLKDNVEVFVYSVIVGFVGHYTVDVLQKGPKTVYLNALNNKESGNHFMKNIKKPSKKLYKLSTQPGYQAGVTQLQQIIREYITRSRTFTVIFSQFLDRTEFPDADKALHFTIQRTGKVGVGLDSQSDFNIVVHNADLGEASEEDYESLPVGLPQTYYIKEEKKQNTGVAIASETKYIDINI